MGVIKSKPKSKYSQTSEEEPPGGNSKSSLLQVQINLDGLHIVGGRFLEVVASADLTVVWLSYGPIDETSRYWIVVLYP